MGSDAGVGAMEKGVDSVPLLLDSVVDSNNSEGNALYISLVSGCSNRIEVSG
jgi:hypothetical protein